eukprot:CAMPEP_0114561282 /NCGR_PEP_ID=MMETSP0114-20121206/11920_1 /TAXON_ID=31324 /ORGANISM="Goniomonas sp, Strain m" /LENGTH=529 /DNA_ID=CAMNT_0001746905 /DNA_START=14 /DNA_END=1601 /DNA_ORIENTATION=-
MTLFSSKSCFLALLLLLPLCSGSSTFQCQTTIDTYNQWVNVGQFQKAAQLTFSPSVRYIIPGPPGLCPYCGTYRGSDAVVSLFVDGFLGHFTIVNPLVNLRQIDSPNGGPGGLPRLLNFNQESFVTNPLKTKGGVGRYFSVPVIHDFLFDASCKITQMTLFQDPYTVVSVFAGYPPSASPVMPFVVFASPPNTFQSTMPASDFQVFPGENTVDGASAWQLVQAYYTTVASSNGNFTSADAALFFMGLNYSIPQAVASLIVPGDPSILPYAGMFMGQDQIAQYVRLRAELVVENDPLSDPGALKVIDQGSVAVSWKLQGSATKTGVAYTCDAVDYFQVLETPAGLRIGRMTRFFDTYAVAMAQTNYVVFPQHAAAASPSKAQPTSDQTGCDADFKRNVVALVATTLAVAVVTLGTVVACALMPGRGAKKSPGIELTERCRCPYQYHTTPHHTAPHHTTPHNAEQYRTTRTAPHRTAPHRKVPHPTPPPQGIESREQSMAPFVFGVLQRAALPERQEGSLFENRANTVHVP